MQECTHLRALMFTCLVWAWPKFISMLSVCGVCALVWFLAQGGRLSKPHDAQRGHKTQVQWQEWWSDRGEGARGDVWRRVWQERKEGHRWSSGEEGWGRGHLQVKRGLRRRCQWNTIMLLKTNRAVSRETKWGGGVGGKNGGFVCFYQMWPENTAVSLCVVL